MAAEWRQVVSEMRCHKIGTEQRILQASVCRCRSLRMLRCPSCGFLPAGLCNGRFAPRFCLLLKMLSGKLHQLQVLMLAMPKCSLLLLQIMKDRTETMSMLLFRSWSSCRSGCLPGCSSTCRDPDAGIATTWLYADMYLNWSDSFVRPEEDAIVSLLNKLGTAYATRHHISLRSTACAGTDPSKKASSAGRRVFPMLSS